MSTDQTKKPSTLKQALHELLIAEGVPPSLLQGAEDTPKAKTYDESLSTVTVTTDGRLLVPDPHALTWITGDTRAHLERGLNPWNRARGWNLTMQINILKNAPQLAQRLAALAGEKLPAPML